MMPRRMPREDAQVLVQALSATTCHTTLHVTSVRTTAAPLGHASPLAQVAVLLLLLLGRCCIASLRSAPGMSELDYS